MTPELSETLSFGSSTGSENPLHSAITEEMLVSSFKERIKKIKWDVRRKQAEEMLASYERARYISTLRDPKRKKRWAMIAWERKVSLQEFLKYG